MERIPISDNRWQEVQNKMMDTLLSCAVEDAVLYELETCPSEEELKKTYSMSPNFKNHIIRELRKRKGRRIAKGAMHMAGKAIACLAIGLGIGFCLLLCVSPVVRAAVCNAIVSWYQDYLSVRFIGEQETQIMTPFFETQYLPDGYAWLEKVERWPATYVLGFQDEQGSIIRIESQRLAGATELSVDRNENNQYHPVNINGRSGYFIETQEEGEVNMLLWFDEEIRFYMEAYLPKDEMLRIAEKIKIL